jgi:hypothetical protein
LSLAHVVAVNDSTEFLVKASLYDGDALAMRNTSLLKRFEGLGIFRLWRYGINPFAVLYDPDVKLWKKWVTSEVYKRGDADPKESSPPAQNCSLPVRSLQERVGTAIGSGRPGYPWGYPIQVLSGYPRQC